MPTPLRGSTAAVISVVATAAVIGGTSPVWAGSSHHALPRAATVAAPSRASSADAATISALRAQVATLKREVVSEHDQITALTRSNLAAERQARDAAKAAAHWRAVAERAEARAKAAAKPATVRTVVVHTPVTAKRYDPAAGHPCDHGSSDPGQSKHHWR